MQIEARVDQQTEISRELSLWGQMGSRVIRGNLLVIPVGDAFIYVEPVYLEAKQEEKEAPAAGTRTQQKPFGRSRKPAGAPAVDKSRSASLPELKRVIVAFGNRLVMEETLDSALRGVLGGKIISKSPGPASRELPKSLKASNLSETALDHYTKAKEQLRQGNWAAFGDELELLEKALKEMAQKPE